MIFLGGRCFQTRKKKGKTEKPPVAHSNSWYAGAPCRVVHLTPGQQRHPSFYLLPPSPHPPPPPPPSSSPYLSHSRHFLRQHSRIRVCLFRINPPLKSSGSLSPVAMSDERFRRLPHPHPYNNEGPSLGRPAKVCLFSCLLCR